MSPSQAFASIANTFFPTEARVLPSSWCPDKDLLALITNVAGKDRLSLWKMQGSKIWEVDVHPDATEGSTESRIVDISWSPDSQSFLTLRPAELLSELNSVVAS